jgi:hypothetical protein
MSVPNTPFLRKVLIADAAIGALSVPLLILGSGPLAAALNLPEPLLIGAGIAVIPFVISLFALARLERLPRWWLLKIVLLNWGWVTASIAILLLAPIEPNALGTAVILAQAAGVALFGWLEGAPLRGHRAHAA